MTAIVQTKRLRLREFRSDDLDDLAAMVGDAEQMRFYPGIRTRGEASAWLSRNLKLYDAHGYGFWLVELAAEGGSFAGYCGIRPLDFEGAAETEIGWHIKKTFWNRGVASEAAGAVREIARSRFSLPGVVALIHPEHAASRRVAEKIGLRITKTTVFEGEPTVIYRAGARVHTLDGAVASEEDLPMEAFREGQKVWVEQEDGSQRAAIYVGEAELQTWFGGGPGVYVVYPDARTGEEVAAVRIVPRDE